MESNIIFLPIALAVLGLLFMFVKMAWVKKQPAGDEKMQGISKAIKEGALAFLGAEYRLLAIFVVIAKNYSVLQGGGTSIFKARPLVSKLFWFMIRS